MVDVIIVGGGIVGTSAAWQLAQRGRSVLLLERGSMASGSTGRGAGVIDVQRWNDSDPRLIARAHELFAQVEAETQGAFAIQRTGALNLAGPAQAEGLERQTQRLREAGYRVELLSQSELASRYPWLVTDDLTLGALGPEDGFLRPSSFVWAVSALARKLGARLFEGTRVDRLLTEGSRVIGVEAGGTRLLAQTVLLCVGAWTRPLLRSIHLDLPMLPYRTQVCFMGVDVPHAPVLHDLTQGIYTVPREVGHFLVGDGTEHWASDPEDWCMEPDDAFLASAASRLRRRVRNVQGDPTGGWAGLCQATPDRYPLLGPFGQREGLSGLHVACGFNGFGVMRGPAVGELLADVMCQGEPGAHFGLPRDLGPYRADRFPNADDFPIREGYEW